MAAVAATYVFRNSGSFDTTRQPARGLGRMGSGRLGDSRRLGSARVSGSKNRRGFFGRILYWLWPVTPRNKTVVESLADMERVSRLRRNVGRPRYRKLCIALKFLRRSARAELARAQAEEDRLKATPPSVAMQASPAAL